MAGLLVAVTLLPIVLVTQRDRDFSTETQADRQRLLRLGKRANCHRSERENRRVSSRFFLLIVDQDTMRRAIHVVILARAHGPEKRSQPSEAHDERDGDKEGEAGHCLPCSCGPRASRSEFATTISELSDIATAAIKGVTYPNSASGTASKL